MLTAGTAGRPRTLSMPSRLARYWMVWSSRSLCFPDILADGQGRTEGTPGWDDLYVTPAIAAVAFLMRSNA